jgi:hypothetical protein
MLPLVRRPLEPLSYRGSKLETEVQKIPLITVQVFPAMDVF